MGMVQTLFYCALVVSLSILIPVLKEALPKPGGVAGIGGSWPRIWNRARGLLIIGGYSIAVSLIVVASSDIIETWKNALILGYLADSTLQKLRS